MGPPKIETPRGKIVVSNNGKASLRMTLEYKKEFRKTWQGRYTDAQKYVDSEVLRRSEPFIPLLSGMLIKSGILGTKIGSAVVQWIAPYAHKQYNSPRKAGSSTGPLRGPRWFDRMKSLFGKKIIAGAKKIAGKGQKP